MTTDNRNEYIVTTNKLVVNCEFSAFFSKFAIVSYYGTGKACKNLAYEQLADVPCLSVTEIRARWDERASVLFFVMSYKGKEQEVLNSLSVIVKTCSDSLFIILQKTVRTSLDYYSYILPKRLLYTFYYPYIFVEVPLHKLVETV